ncbi:exodeoxyribonuclease III [Thiovibrio frasassiensis]|uniref:Exodeoxyribonuclease III n=1 Tax=Thiovibrio frasassiensis TaxID=2984131 RepID=A0A9X4MCX1_9BACT|nr:exodeoxyribonuclease III [Thiovibrio frasassiensis]MDG4475304.1 exodeoxyribonuclease III [Thiovibrio frasassiensis]
MMQFSIPDVLQILAKEVAGYAVPIVDLIGVQTKDPYKVLVATILSARTKDETTAKAAAKLFKEAPDLAGLADLSEERLTKLIFPVGFYKNKAKFLARLPGVLASEFNNQIPDEVEPLTRLPGVGRKTANLVVAVAFKKPAICVDTHVHRIMNIWGYVETKTPLETEMALREKLPPEYWLSINSTLVAFGQGTCRPVAPHCDRCVIARFCPQLGVRPRKIEGKSRKKNEAGMRKFVSWNVNGLRAVEKKGFVEILANLNADLVALQEIKAQPEQLSETIKNIPGYTAYWFSAQKKGYAGVATYSKEEPLSVIYGIDHKDHDYEGRVLTLEFADFYFINAYFPNAQHGLLRMDYKLQFNRDLQTFANTLAKQKSVVICGDFNVAHKEIDLTNPKQNEKNPGYAPQERAWMDEFLGTGFVDTFRMFNQEPGRYTWWSYRFNARERNLGWRIDYFCVDQKSTKRVTEVAILNDIMGSDHCPVLLGFR